MGNVCHIFHCLHKQNMKAKQIHLSIFGESADLCSNFIYITQLNMKSKKVRSHIHVPWTSSSDSIMINKSHNQKMRYGNHFFFHIPSSSSCRSASGDAMLWYQAPFIKFPTISSSSFTFFLVIILLKWLYRVSRRSLPVIYFHLRNLQARYGTINFMV